MESRLSMISSGEVNAKDHELPAMLAVISDVTAPLYSRGLAVAAVGTFLAKNEAPSTVQDLVLMDSLIDVIGQTKNAEPSLLGLSSDDVFKIRSNCCVLLSAVMGTVAGEDAEVDDSQQNVLPMAPMPEPINDTDAGAYDKTTRKRRSGRTKEEAKKDALEPRKDNFERRKRRKDGDEEVQDESRNAPPSEPSISPIGLKNPNGPPRANLAATAPFSISASPQHLYNIGATVIGPQGGADPKPPHDKVAGRALGIVMSTSGKYRVHHERRVRQGQHGPRVGVLFGSEAPRDAKVPLAGVTDVFEVDRRLGYQVPRLWFPHGRPSSAAPKLAVPSERPGPLSRAMRPHTSSLVRNEFHRLEALGKYLQVTAADPTHPIAILEQQQQQQQRMGSQNPLRIKDDLDTPAMKARTAWDFWEPGSGMVPSPFSPSPVLPPPPPKTKNKAKDVSKTEIASKLAGFSYQFSMGAASLPGRRQEHRRKLAWSDQQIEAEAQGKAPTSPEGGAQRHSRQRRPPAHRGQPRKEELDEVTGEVLPPPPARSLVFRDDLAALKAATSTSKAAAKAVAEARAEAKAQSCEMRLHAVVRAPNLTSQELVATGAAEHQSYMGVFENELRTVLAAKDALQQEMVSAIELQHRALPLRFLFTIPGGPAYCRTRLRRALAYWISEFEKNQCVVALGLWRLKVDGQKFSEATSVYRKGAGSTKLNAIMRKMQLNLKARVLHKLRTKVGWVVFEDRDKSIRLVQRMVRRVNGLRAFLAMHDDRPIGGPLADTDMAECRFLGSQVVPRVRDDKRRFWRASIALQKHWRCVVHVRWWRLLRRTTVKLQALVRVVPLRKAFKRMRKASVVTQKVVRMALKRWPYLRWLVHARTLQRVVRGHAARVRAHRRLVALRGALKAALTSPIKIQCAWRAFLSQQCARALRQRDRAEFLAALRIQLGWYRRQGDFSTFVLLGCLREKDQEERDLRRLVSSLFRRRNAAAIQAGWRAYRKARRAWAALQVQCVWRMYVNFVKVGLRRRRRCAGRKLHFWAKGTMKRRHRAARKVGFWWLRAVPGRFLKHLTALLERLEGLELDALRLKRARAAALIQALVHGVFTRVAVGRLRAALKLQRVARGFLGRRRAGALLRLVQRQVAGRFVQRLERAALLAEKGRQRRLRAGAATAIACSTRGFLVRLAFLAARRSVREQVVVATLVQTTFRSHRRTAVAMKDLIAQRRRFVNPFRDLSSSSQVLTACLALAQGHYDPQDPWAGLGLPTVLRRLGLDSDVLSVLHASGVHTLGQVCGLDDRALGKAGLGDPVVGGKRVPGNGGSGDGDAVAVFKPAQARKLLCDFCRLKGLSPKARAALDESSSDCLLVEGFRVLPTVEVTHAVVLKMFEEAYTAKFGSRASNFAESVSRTDVTLLQLRRFFAMHDSPAKAKDRLKDLTQFEDAAGELEGDEKRLLACADVLRYGCERIRDLLLEESSRQDTRSRGANAGGGEGSMRPLLEAAIASASRATSYQAVNVLQERRQRRFERHGTRPALGGPAHADSDSPLVQRVAKVHGALLRLKEVDAAAAFLQKKWRGYAGRHLLALAKHKVAALVATARYLGERNGDHVRLVWEGDRQAETKEYERSYKAWLFQQEREEVEAHLLTVTRFGFEEVFRPSHTEGEEAGAGAMVGGADEFEGGEEKGVYVFMRTNDEEGRALLERPTYGYDENGEALRIQRFMRAMSARLYVGKLRRERLRVAKAAQEREAWEKKKRDREKHVAVTLPLALLDPLQEAALLVDARAEDDAHALQSDLELASLLDYDADLVVGFPVEAKYGGGAELFPGTVYQVNPSQYSTPEGVKWYPKDTFGVLYDDGDFEPATPRSFIRVVKLKVGMAVEARYGGHPAFFAGRVAGENCRGGRVLSYQVEYEDGEAEKAVPRRHIRVDANELLLFQAHFDQTQRKHASSKAMRAARGKAKAASLQSQRARVGASLGSLDAAWGGDWRRAAVRKVGQQPVDAAAQAPGNEAPKQEQRLASKARGKTKAAPAPGEASNSVVSPTGGSLLSGGGESAQTAASATNPAADILGMLRASRQVFHETRPACKVELKIEYTRLPMQFGWQELSLENGKVYYLNALTEDTSWIRPTFDFSEEAAARALQSVFRVKLGQADFKRRIESESLVGVVEHCVGEASLLAWVGFGCEGVTADIWLNRMGLAHLVESVTSGARRKAQRQGLPPPTPQALVEHLRDASTEELKSAYGVDKVQDQRTLEALRGEDASAEAEAQLAFINGPPTSSSSSTDGRTTQEWVAASRDSVHAFLSKAFSGNPTRVEKMADEVAKSRYPLSRAQMSGFLAEFHGKPAMAQEHVRQLVDVPTTHSVEREQACYEVMRSGSKRLAVLAANLNVAPLKLELERVLFRAQQICATGRDPLRGGAEVEEMSHREVGAASARVALAHFSNSAAVSSSSSSSSSNPAGSGHASKAALLLRVEALEAARRWWFASEKVQAVYRGHVARREFLRFLFMREVTCVKLQALWRAFQAREVKGYLKRQQRSVWEELWSEDEGVFYYYSKASGEALWEAPLVPYRPMVRDRFTQRLMQAWPQIENPDEPPPADPGMCMRCTVEEATRTCDQCVASRRAPAWARGKKHLCFVCFAEEHALSADLSSHTFAITKLSKAEPLVCCVCGTFATRRCRGPAVTQLAFDEIDHQIRSAGEAEKAEAAKAEAAKRSSNAQSSLATAKASAGLTSFAAQRAALALSLEEGDPSDGGPLAVPTVKAFREFVRGHSLPFSSERCAVLHRECQGKSEQFESSGSGDNARAEFWRAFLKVLEGTREECSDTYCARCWKDTHRKGRRGKHEWAGFAEAATVCVMCEKNVAERHCEDCDDDLCTSCAVATHLRGKKHRHLMRPLREVLGKSQRHCEVCDIRTGDMDCPLCDNPHCDSCLEFRHVECPRKALVGDPDKPTKCVVCGRPPDTTCVECGDVYCSVTFMGNPGCFAKQHRKGNRKAHTTEPYTYMKDKAAAEKRAKHAKRKEAKELQGKQAKAAADEAARREELLRRQSEREAKILAEARAIIEQKKRSGKAWLKLPVLSANSRLPLFAPLRAAFLGSRSAAVEKKKDTADATEK